MWSVGFSLPMPRPTHKNSIYHLDVWRDMCKTTPNSRIQTQNQQNICRSLFTLLALGSWEHATSDMHWVRTPQITKLGHNNQACSFHPEDLRLPTAGQQGLGLQSMKSPLLAEETGPRHIGHWRNCWWRWQSRHTTWPQGMRTTAGRCSWQMGQVMEVPRARFWGGSLGLAASATGHVAVSWKCSGITLYPPNTGTGTGPVLSTVPSWNPSSTNMARNFCCVTSFPLTLFLTSSLRRTSMLQLFLSFWAAIRHCCVNRTWSAWLIRWLPKRRSFSLATNESTKRSVSSWACAVVWLNSWIKDMALKVWRFCGLAKSGCKGLGQKKHTWPSIQHHSRSLSTLTAVSFFVSSTFNLRKRAIPMSTQSQLKPFSTSLHFFHVLSPPPNLPGTRDSLPALGTCHGIILITHVENPGQCWSCNGLRLVQVGDWSDCWWFYFKLAWAVCAEQAKIHP